MTDQSLFTEQTDQPAGTPPAQEPSNPSALFADQLQAIRNEETGKPKYENLDEALKGLKHSQEYIPQLKSEVEQYKAELEQLKGELGKREAVEDVLARLTANKQEGNPVDTTPQQVAGLSEEAVAKLVESKLQENQSKAQQSANMSKVEQALNSQFGDKARDVIASKAKELNISVKELGELSATKPEFVLAAFNAKQQSTIKPTTTSVTIPGTKPSVPEVTAPTKSLIRGATAKDQEAFIREIQESVYAKHGITG